MTRPFVVVIVLLVASCSATPIEPTDEPYAVEVPARTVSATTPSATATPAAPLTPVPTFRVGRDVTLRSLPWSRVSWPEFGIEAGWEKVERDTPVTPKRVLDDERGGYSLEVSILAGPLAGADGWIAASRALAEAPFTFPIVRPDGSEVLLGDPDVSRLPTVSLDELLEEALGALPIDRDEGFVAESAAACAATRPAGLYATSVPFDADKQVAPGSKAYVLAVESRSNHGVVSATGYRYTRLGSGLDAIVPEEVDVIVCVAERADEVAGYCVTDVPAPRFCVEESVDIEATAYALIAWVVDPSAGNLIAGPWLEPAPRLPETLRINSIPGVPPQTTRAFRPTSELQAHVRQLLGVTP